MVGALVGAGLVVFVTAGVFPSGEAQAERFGEPRFAEQRAGAQDAGQTADLITLSTPAADELGKSVQLVTVIDPKSRVMAVYHVRTEKGEIELKNVRKIDWDLQMEEFNATSPLPREVRSQVAPNIRK
ncbi:MAG TPA: hypothetical protein VFI31_02580 [Pirellulales bacterium]|nr:hypothetical protein [Pirellulales bacterium]